MHVNFAVLLARYGHITLRLVQFSFFSFILCNSYCFCYLQPWRAATLCPFGGLDQFPSVEVMKKNGKTRTLQAIKLESGIGYQWRLWKWASYRASEKIAEQNGGKYEMAVYAAHCSNLKRILPICTDWESACWATAKSWLDVQVDVELTKFRQGRLEDKQYGEGMNGTPSEGNHGLLPSAGPETWPCHVLDQQPRDLPALFQKLHSSEIVNETVSRACKEQHRQIEMNLMLGDIARLLDLLWSWISPSEDDQIALKPHGDPQMMRFGAHVVLVLRYLLGNELKDAFKEKLTTVGDFIIQMYAMFLFSKQHEELVGVYASQLARPLCTDLFVNMMELRLNSSLQVKHNSSWLSWSTYLSLLKITLKLVLKISSSGFFQVLEKLKGERMMECYLMLQSSIGCSPFKRPWSFSGFVLLPLLLSVILKSSTRSFSLRH